MRRLPLLLRPTQPLISGGRFLTWLRVFDYQSQVWVVSGCGRFGSFLGLDFLRPLARSSFSHAAARPDSQSPRAMCSRSRMAQRGGVSPRFVLMAGDGELGTSLAPSLSVPQLSSGIGRSLQALARLIVCASPLLRGSTRLT